MTTFHSDDTITNNSGAHTGEGSAFRTHRSRSGDACAEAAAAEEETRGRGRPSSKTPQKLHAVCTFIRLTGLPDTTAAAMAGVSRSTLSRWKKEDDEVEMQLELARGQYQAPRLAKIDETKRKDGELDWRAQAWLVKFAAPEVHGRPSRRRKLSDVELEESQTEGEAEGVISDEQIDAEWASFYAARERGEFGQLTPGMLAMLQQRRAIALRDMRANQELAPQTAETAEGASPVHEKHETDEKGETEAMAAKAEVVATQGEEAARAVSPAEGAGLSGGVPPVKPCPWGARAGTAKNVTNPPENRELPLAEHEWKACMARFGELARVAGAATMDAEDHVSHFVPGEAARPWEATAD